jgi:OOP family OmpA-OmpF porin
MSIKSSLLLSLAAVTLISAGAHAASDTRKTVYDHHEGVVISKGGCVITKWTADSNPCSPKPAPAPKPVPVAQPAPPPPPPPAPKISREELTIYFDFDKDAVTADGQDKLKHVADVINASPQILKVNIVGYTDQIGTDSYNDKLSEKRANNVKAYLDTLSRIPANVVGLRALGKADPVVHCDDKKMKRKERIACMAKNRRVEVEFQYQE